MTEKRQKQLIKNAHTRLTTSEPQRVSSTTHLEHPQANLALIIGVVNCDTVDVARPFMCPGHRTLILLG